MRIQDLLGKGTFWLCFLITPSVLFAQNEIVNSPPKTNGPAFELVQPDPSRNLFCRIPLQEKIELYQVQVGKVDNLGNFKMQGTLDRKLSQVRGKIRRLKRDANKNSQIKSTIADAKSMKASLLACSDAARRGRPFFHTRTPTPFKTRTATVTPIATATRTRTPTPLRTPTALRTSTPTTSIIIPSSTPTGIASSTMTPSRTHTRTPTSTSSVTQTFTRTPTSIFTVAQTPTRSPTPTLTGTQASTRTATPTPTNTRTPTQTPTPTSTSSVSGPRLYIDNNGGSGIQTGCSDSLTRTQNSIGTPFCSLHKGVSVALPGDILTVRGGVYSVSSKISIQSSGTLSLPITVTSYTGENVELRGTANLTDPNSYVGYLITFETGSSNWVIDNMTLSNFVNGAITTSDNHTNLKFTNLQILDPNYSIPSCGSPPCYPGGDGKRHGIILYGATGTLMRGVATEAPIHIQGTSQATVEDSLAYTSNEDGFNSVFNTAPGSVNVFRNCRSFDNRDGGFDLAGNTLLENVWAYGNGDAGFKLWSGTFTARGLVAYNNRYDGILLDVRELEPAPSILYLSHSTLARNKINLWIGSNQGSSHGATAYLDSVISAFSDYTLFENSFAISANRTGSGECNISTCTFIDQGRNILHRESGVVIKLNNDVSYSASQINLGQVPGILSTTTSVDPLFSNINLFDLRPKTVSTSIVDKGSYIPGYHCPQRDEDNPNQQNCVHWRGASPDIGAFEFGVQ